MHGTLTLYTMFVLFSGLFRASSLLSGLMQPRIRRMQGIWILQQVVPLGSAAWVQVCYRPGAWFCEQAPRERRDADREREPASNFQTRRIGRPENCSAGGGGGG